VRTAVAHSNLDVPTDIPTNFTTTTGLFHTPVVALLVIVVTIFSLQWLFFMRC
jgi:hypothetical protein